MVNCEKVDWIGNGIKFTEKLISILYFDTIKMTYFDLSYQPNKFIPLERLDFT